MNTCKREKEGFLVGVFHFVCIASCCVMTILLYTTFEKKIEETMAPKNLVFRVLVFFILFNGVSIVSATPTPPIKIISGIVSNVVSALFKWLLSLNSTVTPAITSRSKLKFEDGYTVETVFDGSKVGIEPYSVEVSSNGDLLVLDSANSNVHKISIPLSKYSRPKLVAGSTEGYSGHVDGRPREARLNHPKGFTMDDSGNIYVADTMNMAIRKINDGGVTTIAGGKRGRGGHVDGRSEDAKFSNDFDVVYVRTSCSLLVIDRGNMAIREIQLHSDDCSTTSSSSYQYDYNLHLGIAVLIAAALFGYFLAVLQYKVRAMFSSSDSSREVVVKKGTNMSAVQYQRSYKQQALRPKPLPIEDETERLQHEGFFISLGRLVLYTGSTVAELIGGIFMGGFRSKKPMLQQHHRQFQQNLNPANMWPIQDSYVIPDEDVPPPLLETRPPMANKRTYQFMATKEIEIKNNNNHSIQNRGPYTGTWDGDFYKQQQMQQRHHQQQQQQHQRHVSSTAQTCYEKSGGETKEIVFGAVQEEDRRREPVVIKPVDYADPMYNHHNIRSRSNFSGY